MRSRGLILFVVLNLIVTVGAVFLVLTLMDNQQSSSTLIEYRTVQVIITATRDPNETPRVLIVTSTPQPGEIVLPTGIVDPSALRPTESTPSPQTTLDPTLIAQNPALAETNSALPQGCIPHALEEGENPAILAEEFNTDVNSILLVNGLTEADAAFLQIGQILIIPLEGCPLAALVVTEVADSSVDTGTSVADADATDESVATEDPNATPTPTITPTITLPPTAVNAQIEIVEVRSPGDITAEAVVIRNNGRTVNITGWTLSDLDGNTFTFPERNLFSQAGITVYSRVGTSTTLINYWGQSEAVWGEAGDVVILSDANGVVQAVYRIPIPQDL